MAYFTINSLKSKYILPGFILFLGALFILISNTTPTFSRQDTGELIAAGYELGIPHPPGYPLLVITNKISSILIPWGNVGYRANIASSLFLALSMLVIFYSMLMITGQTGGKVLKSGYIAGIISLNFINFEPVMRNCLLADSLSLHIFLSSLLISLSLYVYSAKTGDARPVCLFFFLLGLSLGNHHTAVLVIPAALYLMRKTLFSMGFKHYCIFAVFFLAGFSIYIFPYIRSQINPYLDINNPSSIKNLLGLITRDTYGSFSLMASSGPSMNIINLYEGFLSYLKNIFLNAGYIRLLLLFAGSVWLIVKNRDMFVFLLILFAFTGPIFFILSYNSGEEFVKIIDRLLLINYLSIFIFSYIGAVALCRLCERRFGMKKAAVISAAIILLVTTAKDYAVSAYRNDKRKDFYAYFFAKDILRSLKPPAILFSASDIVMSSLIYKQRVEQKRPDVILLYPAGSVWFRDQMKTRYPEVMAGVAEEKGAELAERVARLNKERFNIYSTNAFIFPQSKKIGVVYLRSLVNETEADRRFLFDFTLEYNFMAVLDEDEYNMFNKEIKSAYPVITVR